MRVAARVKVMVSLMNTREVTVTVRVMSHWVLGQLVHLLNRKKSCIGLEGVIV